MNVFVRRGRDEEGSALVLALVFITVVSLLIGVTLSFAAISVRFGDELAASRRSLYTAEGGIEAAISSVQHGGPCVAVELNGVTPTVSCDLPMSAGSLSNASRPSQAILALGSDPGEGIVQSAGSGLLEVGGDVFSRSRVTANAVGGITAMGSVDAIGDCMGAVVATPDENRHCQNDPGPPVTPTAVLDPGYFKAADIVPAHRAPLPCPSPPGVIEVSPGFYDDAEALSALTDGACPGAIVWFKPGTYYFNFGFSELAVCSGSACVWTIDDPSVKVVGGTSTEPQSTVSLPGACSAADDGVQFIFGGRSRMEVLDGAVELCPPNSAGPKVSVYGLSTPSASPSTTVTQTLVATQASSDTFATPDEALEIDGLLSQATVGSATTPTASVNLEGFESSIPGGSRITSAKLRIRHAQSDPASLSATVAVTPTAGPPLTPIALDDCAASAVCDGRDAGGDVMVTLSEELLDDVAVTYSVTQTGGGSSFGSLDGIWIEVTYIPPYFEALGVCHDPPPPAYPDPSRCAVVTARAPATIAVGGTVYAPSTAVDVDVGAITEPVFGRGVIARTVFLGATSSAPNTPIVALPPSGVGRALTAVGQSVADGISVGGEPLTVRGDVISRSSITVDHPDEGPGLVVQGTVRAGLACSPGEIEADAVSCSNTPTSNTAVDPGYAPPAFVPLPASVPACDPGTMTLDPGWYSDDDAVALFDLTTAGGPCNPKVVWFRPGDYYFNFDFDRSGACAAPPGTACVWTVNDPSVKVVAGEPRGWTPGTTPVAGVFFPGACDASADGARFTFGGPSRMDIQSGSVEICGDRSAESVAIEGLTQPASVGLSKWRATVSTPSDFTPDPNARVVRETDVDGIKLATATPAGSANISMSGFQPVTPIPPGSRISAEVAVSHRELFGVTDPAIVPTSGTIGGSLSPCPTLCTERVTLDDVDDPADLTALVLEYSVQGTGTAYIDGIEVEVTYTPPGYEPLDGCVALPSSNPNTCPLLEAGGTAKVAIQGMIYAPDAAVAIDVDNVTGPVLGQGVIARTMSLDINSVDCLDGDNSVCYDGPAVIGLRDGAPGGSAVAAAGGADEYTFTAYINERRRVRARVAFSGSGVATIRSWAVLP